MHSRSNASSDGCHRTRRDLALGKLKLRPLQGPGSEFVYEDESGHANTNSQADHRGVGPLERTLEYVVLLPQHAC